MNLLTINAGALSLALSAAFGPQAPSTALSSPASRWTDLAASSCTREPHEAGRRELRCPGAGGARVVAADEGGAMRIAVAWLGREVREDLGVSVPPGAALEWRGQRTTHGFEPRALILPVSEAGYAVFRVGRNEVCLVRSVPGPEEARRLADRANGDKTCRARISAGGVGAGP